jgi:hypothetical protein
MNERNTERLFSRDCILIMLAATGTSLCNFLRQSRLLKKRVKAKAVGSMESAS